jgi:hypothetical protein
MEKTGIKPPESEAAGASVTVADRKEKPKGR